MAVMSSGDYYRARLCAELEAIDNATCEEARAAHQALADQYAQLLSAMPDRMPGLELVRDPLAHR